MSKKRVAEMTGSLTAKMLTIARAHPDLDPQMLLSQAVEIANLSPSELLDHVVMIGMLKRAVGKKRWPLLHCWLRQERKREGHNDATR